jgi:membrane protein
VDYLGLPAEVENLVSWLRWVILAIIVVCFLCLVYKIAPARKHTKFKWAFPGALLATILWLLASWGFSFYVKNFGSYGEVYGSISAVVVLLLWLYITSLIILLGAELNAEIEYYALGKSAGNEKKAKDDPAEISK